MKLMINPSLQILIVVSKCHWLDRLQIASREYSLMMSVGLLITYRNLYRLENVFLIFSAWNDRH